MKNNECLHHKLLFLRLLSLIGKSVSLFNGAILGITREHSPWCSTVPVAVDALCSVPQQTLGTGNPSRVNVWVWNWGKLANRLLTASCSSRLFLCLGPSPEAADKLNTAPWSLELKCAGSPNSVLRFRPFTVAFCFFSPSFFRRAKMSACSASTRRSLSSTSKHAF